KTLPTNYTEMAAATAVSSSLRSSLLSSSLIRRRLPLVGAFCMLSFGLSNLSSPVLRSKFSTEAKSSSVRMEGGSNNTVPSIVVYVTVPSREAGKKLANSIVKERLAACVNIVPGECFILLDSSAFAL
ncbi:Protein CutA, chloroplastic, partial [Linum perenne]